MVRRPSDMKTEERHEMRGGTGTVRFRHFFTKEELRCPLRLVAELVLEPGASIGMHRHEGEEEIFVVCAGRGEVSEDGATWSPIGAGDAILTGAGESHTVRATGETLIMIAVIGTFG